MRKPKLRELKEAVRSLLTGPYTLPFPKKPSPASAGYRGVGRFNEEECIGCTACAEVCPCNAIKIIDVLDSTPPVRRIVRHHDECIFCGQCELKCTTGKGVELTPEYDLATLDRTQSRVSIEKQLVLCELCGEPIATQAHLRWIARRLGPQRFTNPTLIISFDESLGAVGKESGRRDVATDRTDIMRVLCPKCRREVIVTDMWG